MKSEKVSLHEWLFKSPVDGATSHRRLPFSNTLVLTGFDIYRALKIDDPAKVEGRDFLFSVRGRDLRGANLDLGDLSKIDFSGAWLDDARFDGAELKGASFACVKTLNDPVARPFDVCTQLRGASFMEVDLEGVSFEGAQPQGANFYTADLRGATFENANLEGVFFFGAELQGAELNNAPLQGASLENAQLQGAWLESVQLQGASLDGARLQGAYLLHGTHLVEGGAQLQGASLKRAQLQGANLQGATLDATDLSGAFLWRTNVSGSPLPEPKSVRLSEPPNWGPSWIDEQLELRHWDDKAYQELRKTIAALAAKTGRTDALENISRLDCHSADTTLAPCNPDPSLPPPREPAAWREALENAARINVADYEAALAAQLKTLVCPGAKMRFTSCAAAASEAASRPPAPQARL